MLKYALLLILALMWVTPAEASVLFSDEFSGEALSSHWEFVNGYLTESTSWFVNGGKLNCEVGQGSFSYLYAKDLVNLDNFEFYSDVTNQSGVDQPFVFRVSQDRRSFYQIEFRYVDEYWPQDGNNIKMYRFNGGIYTELANVSPTNLGNQISLSQNRPHRVHVTFDNRRIKVYFDNILAINYVDNSHQALSSGSLGIKSWGGDYYHRSIKNQYDNIKVTSLGYVEPPPTPVAVVSKIIILPGLGAGWNTEAILENKIVPDDQWTMNDWATNYVGLTRVLDAKGLVRDRDYFVWNYDWRRPMSEIVYRFNEYLNSKIGSGDKVDLVGHSLGGLVARSWTQDHKDDSRLNKVISLGSPNFGAVKAYDVWNGTQISDPYDLQSIAISVLMQLQKSKYGSPVLALRANAPIMHDLLPVFDYVKKSGKVVSVSSMSDKSDYLLEKSLTVNQVFDKYKAIIAVGHQTKEWINLGERNVFDQVLGLWPEGSPTSYSYGVGDGTVLKKSAKFDGDGYDEVTAMHGWMTNAALPKLFTELGLGDVAISLTQPNFSNYLVYFMGSPAEMTVNCDGQQFAEDANGFIVFPNMNYQTCKLGLEGKSAGTYHLVTGKVGDDNSWNYFENELGVGETRNIVFDPKTGLVKNTPDNKVFLWEQVKKIVDEMRLKYPGSSDLGNVSLAVSTKNSASALNGIFGFRKQQKESTMSGSVFVILEKIVAIENASSQKSVAYSSWVAASQQKSLVDTITRNNVSRNLKPSVFGANSYKYLGNELTEAKKAYDRGDYGLSRAQSIMVTMLVKEVW